ncbi:GH39 family glycosyl hydrolase [Paenibacillus gansuensis]|uniref:Glycosyl hydrolases family 39 N-terminal catalytic domain-containing protein n=1 Tax=Paenibacillus gansuensis TaxID=306542 RepID=A0ABW5PKB5_9BACL
MKQKWKKFGALTVAAALVTSLISFSPVSAASVTATVNWGSNQGSTTNYSYGLNIFKAQEGTVASDTDYKNNVAYMKPGIIRYHRADQMGESTTGNGWVKNPGASNYSWDAAKIGTILSNTFSNNPTRMINIANWPAYMDDGTGKLKTTMYDAYAAFCANLVQIVNIDQGRNVQYWEVLNEKDDTYASNMAELATIYKKAYDAMRAKSSTIKIGGPAFARPDLTARVDTFVANAHTKLDFISYHTYSSGSTSDTNASIWNSAQGLGATTTSIKNIIANYTTRAIETFHDEYNISWNPPDGRMNNEKGMIFDALSLISITKAGATGSMAWNESDGWYGKLEGWAPYNKRASAHLYNLFNTDMGGTIAGSTTSDASKIDLMGTYGGSWKKLALVNRSGADQTLQLSFSGWSTSIPGNTLFTVKRVYGWGVVYDSVRYDVLTSSAGYTLPADSVTLLILDENNKSYATATNYITNPKFDSGMTGWSTWALQTGDDAADYTETYGGRDGAHLTHWKNAYYGVHTYQTVTGLTNGTYTLKAWVTSSGGQFESRMEAKNFGGTQINANIPAGGWTQISIPNINVTNGQIEVGFWSKANAGNSVYIDDVELTKN